MTMRTLLAVALVVSLSGIASAELQNVEVGGNIRIRGNYFNLDSITKQSFVEQRTRLNVKADFTQEVSAFIEFDYYSAWGEDFRSWYLCGNDFRSGGNDNDVALYQGYIEAQNMWDTPLSMRVGRQEIALGNQFLVGVRDSSSFFYGLSFDALRLTFANDMVNIDAIAAKLAENYGDFMEDDVDFYAVYASYVGIEDVTLDAYWMFVRDDEGAIGQQLLNADDINLHTIGLRGAGMIAGFDFDLEAAYQFGTVHGVRNPWFRVFNRWADVDYDEFAVNTEVGYTFDMTMQPRIFAHFAYLGGGKPNDSCWDNDYTMPFTRMFSNIRYSEFLDNWTGAEGALSNVFVYGLGAQAMVGEAVELKLVGSYLEADQAVGRRSGNKKLGWEVGVYGDYQYSEDLVVRAGYAHFFGKRGLETAPVRWSGLASWDGDREDDYDYAFVETEIQF